EQGFQNAIAGADRAIVVTTPEKSSVRDADRIIGLIEQADIEAPSLLINRIRNHMMQSGDMLDIDEIEQILSIDIIGIVTDDDEVIKASNTSDPVAFHPNSKPPIAYGKIARRILGVSVPLHVLAQKVCDIQRLKNVFGMRS